MKTLSEIQREFIKKFSVWNQEYKFAEKPCCDVQEWTPPEVSDWWSSSLKELLEQVVPEEKPSTDINEVPAYYQAYDECRQEVEDRIRKIIG